MAHILIIDDNADMLSMLQMLLEKRAQHQTLLCANGEEGLKVAFSQTPDIALVDVMMPDMSGYEVVRRLRANPQTETMGIIVLTARGQPVDRDAAMNAGADEFLTKPVNFDELNAKINTLLRKLPTTTTPGQSTTTIVPVFSLRGGVGVTTIAVNLATLLQLAAPTLLVDLSPNSGHCNLFLGLKAQSHWGHYLQDRTQPLESHLLRHASGLHVLAAPPIPLEYGWFAEEDIISLLESIQSLARFIVIDMPPVLNQVAEVILNATHQVLLITGDDPPSVQTTLTTIKAMETWYDHILLIRNMNVPSGHPPLEALQRALNVPLVADIPFDPTQSTALRKGVPLIAAQPKGDFATALKQALKTILTS
ncbi:MAG: response regulator [Anaerolineae bacterium]|nr:response regulator [Anaerolineae bacterium]